MVKVKSRSYNDKRPCGCTIRRFTNEKPGCDPSGEARETSKDYFCVAANTKSPTYSPSHSIGRNGNGWSGLEAPAPDQRQVPKYRVAAVDLQLHSPGQCSLCILYVPSRIATSKLWHAIVHRGEARVHQLE